ncbi:MAG: hypothetical protein HUU01_15045 [Saprospiraceae bacterium]|nr:hypothetical protein [Saprospiraceae bacterium]
MKLILIHGRAQEAYEELELKKDWIAALNKGMKKAGRELPPDTVIEFPYYGKLLQKLVEETEAEPQDRSITRSGRQSAVSELDEIEFYEAMLGEMATNAGKTQKEKAALLEMQTKTRGITNWDITQKLLAFLDRKQTFGDWTLKSFTRDVFMYLTINHIKKQVNDHVLKSFDAEPCVVVGHSLGSVVSYLVLKNNPHLKVKKLITIGSPLGLKSVSKYTEPPLIMPESILSKNWFNAYDERDVVALNPLSKEHFNISPPVVNYNKVKNDTKNRHGSDGYLKDATVAEAIYQAVTGE